jgi:hypothetical protein
MKIRFTISLITSRGVKCSPAVSRQFSELANQLLEHQPYLGVAHRFRVQVDLGEALGRLVGQPRFLQPIHLQVELEALEDVAHRRREGLDVAAQVFADVVLIRHPHQEGLGIQALAFPQLLLGQSTASLVGSSTQSSRRSTVNGRITLP